MPLPYNIILLTKPDGVGELISPGVATQIDPTGFDTVTARYIQQGSAASVASTNLPGSGGKILPVTGGSSSMFFMGISDAVDLPGNCCEYTLTWRGILANVPSRNVKVTQTRSIRERYFESLSGVTGVPASSRVRLMEQQSGLSVRLIHIGSRPTAPTGAQTGALYGVSAPNNQFKVSGAPITYVFPSGWLCYSWQAEEPIPGIWFVSAEYKYEFAQQSG